MPELPEVEANLRVLSPALGRRIERVTPPAGRRETGGLAPAELRRRLEGRRLERAARRGKWILATLEGGGGLAIHLGMTGKLAWLPAPEVPAPRFTRAVLHLEGGARVCFVDSRRFGRLLAGALADLTARPEIARVGPDALGVTPARLGAALAATGRTVKEALLDQERLSGIGNIYATEALWRARVHPARRAREVAGDRAALRRLSRGIREALALGLRTYVGDPVPEYIEEGGANPFQVYDRAGEACPRCGARIEAMVLGGRTTAWCPGCQAP